MKPNTELPVERVMPYASDESKRKQVAKTFDTIAPRYDRLNRVLSLGLDTGWRRSALNLFADAPPARLLDVATGTGDFALLAAHVLPQSAIVGVDLSEGMLAAGRRKVAAAGLEARITLQTGDAQSLPFPDGAFDAATVAFGVRNFESLASGLAEIGRVLKSGGRIVILELSSPRTFPLRPLHRLYLRYWIPLMGRLLTGHTREYAYLPASIAQVPQDEAMLELLSNAGFTGCRFIRYAGGICTCYTGIR